MKKFLSVLLVLTVITISLCGCDSSDKRTTTTTTTQIFETQTTSEIAKKMKDYLPDTFELKDELLNYFESCGYNFDDWYVFKSTSDEYVFTKSGGGAGLVVSKTNLTFNLGTINNSANCVTYNPNSSELAFIDIIISSDMFDAYDIYDLILKKCPNDLKLSGQTLNDQLGTTIGEYVDVEKDNTYYRLSRNGTSSGYLDMIGVYNYAPGVWNPVEIDAEDLISQNVINDILENNNEVFIVCDSTETESERTVDIYEIIINSSNNVNTKNYTLEYNDNQFNLELSSVSDGMPYELVEEDGIVKMASTVNNACLVLICDEQNRIIGFDVEGGERFDELASDEMINDCIKLK